MIDRNNPLIREATSLPPLDKLQLVDYLLESLDMPDAEIEKLWAEESYRRREGYIRKGESGGCIFSWEGFDEGDSVSGFGEFVGDGDDSSFTVRKFSESENQ